MSKPPYGALRIILGIFSFFAAAAGLLLIFSGKPLMLRLFLRPPESEVSTLLLLVMKEMGGFVLMFSVLFFSPLAIPPAMLPSSTRSLRACAY